MDGTSKNRGVQLLSYRPLVKRLAHQLIGRLPANIELDDLVQVGMMGLNDSLDRFNPDHGVIFETFATQRIRGAMLDELRGMDWMSRGDRRMQRSIEAAVSRLQQRLGRPPQECEIAQAMKMSLCDYQKLLGKVRGVELVYLEDMTGDDGDDDYLSRYVVEHQGMVYPLVNDPSFVLQNHRRVLALDQAMKRLPDREYAVLSMYHERDMNMKQIAVVLRVTESRICQLYDQAVKRLRVRLLQH